MPHICTRCNSVFESGEDILKGCPSCGWKKFMFVRKLPQEVDMPAVSEGRLITSAMGVRKPPRRAEMILGMARDGDSIKEDPSHASTSPSSLSKDPRPDARAALDEQKADAISPNRKLSPDMQSSASTQLSAKEQSAVKSSSKRPAEERDLSASHPEAGCHSTARQSEFLGPMEEKALESVRITAPGTYELNLPSLFERDELIMAVKEGTYFIDLTSAFKKSKKD